MKIVIIGSNTAGISVARSLIRNHQHSEVTIIEREPLTPYAACSMTDLIAGRIDQWQNLHGQIEELYGVDNLKLVSGCTVSKLEPRHRQVIIENAAGRIEVIAYDYLVLATGSTPIQPDNFKAGARTFEFKTLPDALRLHKFIGQHSPKTMIVIGSGPIGLSLSLALQARGISVSLLDRVPTPVSWLHPEFGRYIRQALITTGIQVYDCFTVAALQENSHTVEVSAQDGRIVHGDGLVLAMGFKPRTDLALQAGLTIGKTGGIVISTSLRTSNDRILAAGDCTESKHLLTRKPVFSAQAARAALQGRLAAYSLGGNRVRAPDSLGTIIHSTRLLELGSTGINPLNVPDFPHNLTSFKLDFPKVSTQQESQNHVKVLLYFDPLSRRLYGVQAVGRHAATIVRQAVPIISQGLLLEDVVAMDLGYHPDLGPLWHPLIVTAQQAIKQTS